ncbi:MAG: glycosyltransferase family 2 protein [Cytophagales bacterium]|nr:MAG: glycosyltransferase family 2 protein [Cytophagales bacterium]
MSPLFSIVIPTYNRAHLIVPTLQSVLHQTFRDFEILVIDDGSTDETEDVVEINFPNQSKIKYIRKKNEERSVARNTGFHLAKGEYVVFFDSDDIMLPHYLHTLHKAIEEHPNCNFFATKYQIDTDSVISTNEIASLKEGFYDYQLLLKGNIFGTMVAAKKQNANFYPFPPTFSMCEDWIFNMLNLKNDKIYLIDTIGITIINHQTRSMANNDKAIKGRIEAMKFIKKNITFKPKENRLLEGYTYQFCAIHSYIDEKQMDAFVFLLKAVFRLGISIAVLALLAKIILGKNIISRLRQSYG